ncbi:protein YvfG [Bacillus kexueae]|uniref:protein YvfG n=1 Tax=Aeribacillus kexueae TaxID=2078952 RepID=UPI001FAF12BE|nr:protein YvfG [Bacillus kexueae]
MTQMFSVPYFEENFRQHLKMNANGASKIDAMNSYYRSVVSTLVHDQLTKNAEVLKRIQNLDVAYNNIKSEL